ncbi:MAG: hypothetical protein ABIO80_00870 [Sphingomicrobium sp.]
MIKPIPPSDFQTQPIGQSTALVILVMVVGITAYLWFTGHMRSRVGLIFVAMIVAVLAYFALWTNPITSP